MMNRSKTVRITATLPSIYLDELKQMAEEQQIPSVNFAIRQALEAYLKQVKKREYDEMMQEAAKDAAFLARTEKCAEDFDPFDSEVLGEW